jgi:hypothetical protein
MIEEGIWDAQETGTEITPRFCALKLDETRHWEPGIADRARRIFGVYLFDANKHVHCCEFTPSYECLFVESQFENPGLPDQEQDRLDCEIRQVDVHADPVRYFHCYQIDGLPRIREGELAQGVIDLEIANEEEALEYVRLRGV